MQHFTDRSVKVISIAREKAKALGHVAVSPEHVLLAIAEVEHGPGRIVLERLGVYLEQHVTELSILADTPSEQHAKTKLFCNPATESVLQQSKTQAKGLHHNYVGTEHLVLGLLSSDTSVAAKFLFDRGVSLERFREELLRFLTTD